MPDPNELATGPPADLTPAPRAAAGTLTQTDDTLKALILGAAKLLSEAESYKIETQDDLDASADLLARIKGQRRRAEDARTAKVGPLNQQVKAINAGYKAPDETLDKAESKLKAAQRVYLIEQDKRRRILEAAQE